MKKICVATLLLIIVACAPSQTPNRQADPTIRATPTVVAIAAAPTQTPTSPTVVEPSPSPSAIPTRVPTLTKTPAVRLMAVGDLMIARTVAQLIVKDGPAVLFAGVGATLKQADVLAANLECTISDRGLPQPKAYRFRAPLLALDALKDVGVAVVSQANNHALDFGPDAFLQTLELLNGAHIGVVGAGTNVQAAHTPAIIERNGLRLAFLAYVDVPIESSSGFDTRSWIATDSTPGVAWARAQDISRDVAAARTQADLVVVLLHSGYEYRTEPNTLQRAYAHAAIDAGAALVIGSHPHVLQGTEKYKNGLIAYSLGNFVADGFEGKSNYSVIFDAMLTRSGVATFDFIPVVVKDGLPRLANPEEAPTILELVKPIP